MKAVLAAIPRTNQHRIRYAEPGEFTRRAFYNSRLDLTEVEALGDTLAAETEQQRQLAVRGSSNTLGERYEEWRQKLLYARGELEALIDFSEDQQFDDTPNSLLTSVTDQVGRLKFLLQTSIENAFRGELLRNGISVALLGAPNAGKSSLLNKVVRREAAIVCREAGTTRDVVEVGIDIGGFYCRFGDLAGLRTSSDVALPIGAIELEGMRRARERALEADVVIVVLSVDDNSCQVQITPEVAGTLRELNNQRQDVIYLVNKVDLLPNSASRDAILPELKGYLANNDFPSSPQPLLLVTCINHQEPESAHRGSSGIPSLMDSLLKVFRSKTSAVLPEEFGLARQSTSNESWAESLGASERHRVLLGQCLSHLEDYLGGVVSDKGHRSNDVRQDEVDVVVAAENLRNAADCLGKITGRGEGGDVEEVLGVVFEKFVAITLIALDYKLTVGRFCVGK